MSDDATRLLARITCDPAIFQGAPIIRGMRSSVRRVPAEDRREPVA